MTTIICSQKCESVNLMSVMSCPAWPSVTSQRWWESKVRWEIQILPVGLYMSYDEGKVLTRSLPYYTPKMPKMYAGPEFKAFFCDLLQIKFWLWIRDLSSEHLNQHFRLIVPRGRICMRLPLPPRDKDSVESYTADLSAALSCVSLVTTVAMCQD